MKEMFTTFSYSFSTFWNGSIVKKWLIYSLILLPIAGLSILFYGELREVARKKEDKNAFEQRRIKMQNEGGSIRRTSPVWNQLDTNLKRRLRSVGFFPARPSNLSQVNFSLPGLKQDTRSFTTFHDRWVLLNFWATWCAPCRYEMPSLNKLQDQFPRDQLSVVGVNLQEDPRRVKSFVENTNIEFSILLDRKGTVANSFYVKAVPETWLITPGGRPLAKMNGSRDWATDGVISAFETITTLNFDVEESFSSAGTPEPF